MEYRALPRRRSSAAPADVATPRTLPIKATPPLAALLLEPKAEIALPPPPLAMAVRFMIVPVEVASIEARAVEPGAGAEDPPALPPPLAVDSMVRKLGPF